MIGSSFGLDCELVFVKKTNIYLMGLFILIYIIIFRLVIMKYFLAYTNIVNILFFGVLSLWGYYAFGFPKRNTLRDYNVIQVTTISFLIYYIIIYIMGLFFGFVSNVYSLTIYNIIKNVLLVGICYVFRELFRYIIFKTCSKNNKKALIFVTILITLLDIIMEINISDFNNLFNIIEFICESVIPNIAINLMLSYLAYHFSYRTLLFFVMIWALPTYVLPIFPNLGSYFGGILEILLLFYCYYEFSIILEKWERKIKYNRKYNKKINLVFVFIPIFILVGLISGLFKYHLLAIVSNSMIPYFSRGDGVLIEKISKDDVGTLKIGDVVAYNYGNKLVVHRIVEITKNRNKYLFKTKGDNNLSVDSWTVSDEMVYGKVICTIKYIGIPSVEVSELLN